MADASIKMLISVIDRASAEIKKITGSVDDMDKGLGSTIKTAISWTAALAAAGVVIDKVVDFTKKAVTETVAYNRSIREMAQVTGLGVEEISRIVQVGDDWNISIDALRTSLAFMNKTGVTPSIDNLAALADEYVATADKSAFAEKAVKLLGRGYQTLIPLLALGGDGFRKATAAVEDNLVATNESIAASRKYEVAMDTLNDTVTGLKYSLAEGLLPAINNVLGSLNSSISTMVKEESAGRRLKKAIDEGTISRAEYNKAMWSLRIGTEGYIKVLEDLSYDEAIAKQKMDELNASSDQLDRVHASLGRTTDNLTESTVNLNDAMSDVNEVMKEYNDKLIFLTASTYLDADAQLALAQKLGLVDSNTTLLYAGIDNLNKIYDTNKNGVIDVNEKTNDYINAIIKLKAEIDGLKDKTVRVDVYTTNWITSGGQAGPHQKGANYIVPPGYNENWNVGTASSGEQVIIIPKPANSSTVNNTFVQNVHTNAGSSTVMRDFNMMKAMAG